MSVFPGVRRRPVVLLLAGTVAAGVTSSAHGHDFWLVPNAFQLAVNDTVIVFGQTSSRFPVSESAVATERVAEALLIGPSRTTRIADLSVANKSLRLRARPDQAAQYVIAARLAWRSTRESAEGFQRYLRLEGAPEAADRLEREGSLRGRDSVTRRYAKYAKTFVDIGTGGGRSFSKQAGHPLEFMPHRDPMALRSGDTLTLTLTFQGSPLAGARVHAGAVRWTGSGAPQEASETAKDVHLTSDAKGNIRVPVTAGGLWNVRTLHIAPSPAGSGADWETHWATIVFHVAGSAVESISSSDSLAVARVVEAYDEALRRGDSLAAVALLNDDAVILESGGVESVAEYRSHHLAGDIAYARAVTSRQSPIRVTVRQDVAWAWSTSTTQGNYRGRAVDSAGAELMVLTRTRSGWKIAAIHWSSRSRSR